MLLTFLYGVGSGFTVPGTAVEALDAAEADGVEFTDRPGGTGETGAIPSSKGLVCAV
jgi:hypothetical protein